jgi:hypothetical protein
VIEIRSGARRWWNTDERLTTVSLLWRPTMAKRNDMSAARRSRNREQEPTPQSTNTIANEQLGDPAGGWAPPRNPALAKIISDGQNRLMKAQAVLGCVEFALVYEDWLDRSQRPSFADAVAVAQDLVSEAIAQLART